MSEIIYVLTVIYCVYVIDEVQGEKIVVCIKDVLHIELSFLHKTYRSLRDSILNSIGFKRVSFA